MIQQIRIGKDISIEWFILSNGVPVSLEDKNLRLEMTTPLMKKIFLPVTVTKNIVRSRYPGIEQKHIGIYSLTLWQDWGRFGQTCVDSCKAFKLVSKTCQEPSCGINPEPCVTLCGNLYVGVRGESAYEIALRNGFLGSEQEWLESLKGKDFTNGMIPTGIYVNDKMQLVIVSGDKEERFTVSINPRGEWEEEKVPFNRFDLVSKEGSSYLSLIDNNTENPLLSSKNWQVIALKGEAEYKLNINELTPDDLALLQMPATQAAQSLSAFSKKIECLIEESEPALDSVIQYNDRLIALELEVFPYTLTVSGGGVHKKGLSTDITVSWEMRRGSQKVEPDKVTVNGSVVEDIVSEKTFNNVTTNTTYEVVATKDDKSITESTSVTFVNPSYYGVVSNNFTVSSGNISALQEIIKTGREYEGTATTSYQKVCYAYPSSFGELESIKDGSNQEILGSWTKSSLQMNGENYHVYVLSDASTVTDYVLKFI